MNAERCKRRHYIVEDDTRFNRVSTDDLVKKMAYCAVYQTIYDI